MFLQNSSFLNQSRIGLTLADAIGGYRSMSYLDVKAPLYIKAGGSLLLLFSLLNSWFYSSCDLKMFPGLFTFDCGVKFTHKLF